MSTDTLELPHDAQTTMAEQESLQTSSLTDAAASIETEEANAQATSGHPQGEIVVDDFDPIAIVLGKAFTQLPKDLYIPPEALEVFLETFEGPLDLLLYLIKRQNLDILNIPIASITHQYMEYVELMKDLHFELAADYLVMAAMLAEIKSRMLLPRPASEEEDEQDPRAELIRRLQEYERFKKAAEDLDTLPRLQRDVFQVEVKPPQLNVRKLQPNVELKDLIYAFKDVLVRSDMFSHHHVQMEPLSVREKMSSILSRIEAGKFISFAELFTISEGRLGVVVTFLAVLELVRESLLELVQTAPYEPIHVTVAEGCRSQQNN